MQEVTLGLKFPVKEAEEPSLSASKDFDIVVLKLLGPVDEFLSQPVL